MKTNFKVGDNVWDDVNHPGLKGAVSYNHFETDSLIVVKFGGFKYLYSGCGTSISGTRPTLSKVPYKFELPEQPVEFQEGDPVLVRDKDEHIWTGSRYKCKGLDDHYPYETLVGSTSVSWRQCIPFDIEKMGRV